MSGEGVRNSKPESSAVTIDCDECVVRGPVACDDCVVAFLLAAPSVAATESPVNAHGELSLWRRRRTDPVVLRAVEVDELARLAAVGLVPPLQHRRGA